ncbi:group 1 truncated hemoglobin [Chroococcus sp. FPU101]|uniref:group I truncated hemoglobin n=1 Tax=Chroococcus sp. FPU101 TaxID=1974212 RepID=UPI001A8EC251|nr:group 1 truncated hemoglobin [Chroococcus sp. FPU101]GFE68008.1 globin [Chroococcus sp. FPU101]
MNTKNTVLEQLGGVETVRVAVEHFYNRVLQDNRINHFFAGVDMVKQKAHQTAFLSYALGGSNHYEGMSMRKAHQHLVERMGLNNEHFDAVVEDLVKTLEELKVAPELIEQVVVVLSDPNQRKNVLNQ